MGASHSSSHNNHSSSQMNGKQDNKSTMNGKYQPQPQNYIQEPPKLKGILKNKDLVKNETINHEPARVVELYVQRGDEWTRTRVREDEKKARMKELKSDKTVKRIYEKPKHDTTYLYTKAV